MKENECPDCRDVEDDQYCCTVCWGTGGLYKHAEPCETCGAKAPCSCKDRITGREAE